MDIQLYLDGSHPLNFNSGLPDGFTGPRFPGSKAFHTAGPQGSIIIQEHQSEGYNLRLNIFQFLRKISLKFSSESKGLHGRIMLRQGLTHRIPNLGKHHIRENHQLLVYAEGGECMNRFDKNREYHCFDLFFAKEFLQLYIDEIPHLRKVLMGAERDIRLLHPAGKKAEQAVLDIIKDLLASPFDAEATDIFTEEKVAELLEALLQKENSGEKIRLTEQEEESLQLIREHIEQNYRQHFTIPQLARKSGLNEFKLKSAFRQRYGMGLFDCLLQVRMRKALDLVRDQSYPMKQIASMVGYRRLPSFVTAFRKFYGKPPGKMRYNK